MTDDEVIKTILEYLNQLDREDQGAHVNIGVFIGQEFTINDDRRIGQITNTLRREGLIQDYGQSWGSRGRDQQLTDKGRHVIENGGWPAYNAAIEERERKAAEAARLADIKAKGEALQFKYWWVGLAGFAISVLTAGWTIYQDTTDDTPTRAEFDRVRAELDSLRKTQVAPVPKFAKPTQPISKTAK